MRILHSLLLPIKARSLSMAGVSNLCTKISFGWNKMSEGRDSLTDYPNRLLFPLHCHSGAGFNGRANNLILILRHVQTTKNWLRLLLICYRAGRIYTRKSIYAAIESRPSILSPTTRTGRLIHSPIRTRSRSSQCFCPSRILGTNYTGAGFNGCVNGFTRVDSARHVADQ